jgi:hypothetical protein
MTSGQLQAAGSTRGASQTSISATKPRFPRQTSSCLGAESIELIVLLTTEMSALSTSRCTERTARYELYGAAEALLADIPSIGVSERNEALRHSSGWQERLPARLSPALFRLPNVYMRGLWRYRERVNCARFNATCSNLGPRQPAPASGTTRRKASEATP